MPPDPAHGRDLMPDDAGMERSPRLLSGPEAPDGSAPTGAGGAPTRHPVLAVAAAMAAAEAGDTVAESSGCVDGFREAGQFWIDPSAHFTQKGDEALYSLTNAIRSARTSSCAYLLSTGRAGEPTKRQRLDT